jgi:histone acetyltransferase (RNA polymerase elongator complex component)
MNNVTVPFFISHQGCPHTCIFCDQRTISGCGGEIPGSDEIASKILGWQHYSANRPMEVAFFGGTFTALSRQVQQQLLMAVQPFLTSGDITAIRISTRPDSLDTETVQWLADQGVKIIEVGVQSMDDDVLAASGRGHDARTSLDAIHCIKSCGLSAGAQLMPGLPGDTPTISHYSLKRVITAGVDFIRLYPTVVFRETQLAQQYLAGEYRPLTIDGGVAVCKVLVHTALKLDIPVIRIGLQANEGLSHDSILAGCWHPALGDLVYSELFFDLLMQMVGTVPTNSTSVVRISCHPSRISSVIGHKRKNIFRLHGQGITVDHVTPNPALSLFECEICSSGRYVKGSIVNDLTGLYA